MSGVTSSSSTHVSSHGSPALFVVGARPGHLVLLAELEGAVVDDLGDPVEALLPLRRLVVLGTILALGRVIDKAAVALCPAHPCPL